VSLIKQNQNTMSLTEKLLPQQEDVEVVDDYEYVIDLKLTITRKRFETTDTLEYESLTSFVCLVLVWVIIFVCIVSLVVLFILFLDALSL
jgi:hypothetical protein